MINPSRVLVHPHFRQTWKVFRSSGHFGQGGWIEDIPSPAYFEMVGVAWPSSAKEIEQVPEADRVQGMHTFASATELFVTHASGVPGTSDRIEWRNEQYKIIQKLSFDDYGFCVVVGARLEGA
jgi:hypothetical protein